MVSASTIIDGHPPASSISMKKRVMTAIHAVRYLAAKTDKTIGNMRIDANSALLAGFDSNAAHSRLRYGDSISIIPNGLNALVIGSRYGKTLVEVLQDDAAMPPNLRDCEWRLLPAQQLVEKKKLRKIIKANKWNEGRSESEVPRPQIPNHLDDLSKLAEDFCNRYKLIKRETKTEVEKLLLVLMTEEEEREGNASDLKRQMGAELRYGSNIVLVHEGTGLTLGITKMPCKFEPSCRNLELAEEASERSVCRLMPAIKVMAEGSPVMSGDFIAFHFIALIGGSRFHLHMSQEEQRERSEIDHKLALRSEVIKGIFGINAAEMERENETCFRVLLFQPGELKTKERGASLLKGGDVTCFYNKQMEAFLEFDPFGTHGDSQDKALKWDPRYLQRAPPPGFYTSKRLDSNSRKKTHWIWKVESEFIYLAGDKVVANGNKFYRIKHIPSNLYLICKGDELACTLDLRDERTLFGFSHFSKGASPDAISTSEPVLITSKDGRYLCLGGHYRSERHHKAQFLRCDMQPDLHAIVVVHLSNREITPLIHLGRSVRVLQNWEGELQDIPEVPNDEIPSGDKQVGPSTLPEPTQRVLKVMQKSQDVIMEALGVLVLSCSIDHYPRTKDKPLLKEGVPNRYAQKVLRELGVIPLLMHLLEDPFRRGVSANWLIQDERFFQLGDTMNLIYRLLKQMVRSNVVNSSILFGHVELIRFQLGKQKGAQVALCLSEMFKARRSLLLQVPQSGLIQEIFQLLEKERAAQLIDLLISVSSCQGQGIQVNQDLICECLLQAKINLLPICRSEETNSQFKLFIHVPRSPGSTDAAGQMAWLALNGIQKPAFHSIMQDRYIYLTQEQKDIRYFIRCQELYSHLTLGRNQKALRMLLQNPKLALGYNQILNFMQEETLPALLRALEAKLMLQLYVDRYPQSPKASVHLTRIWSEVLTNPSQSPIRTRTDHQAIEAVDIPACPDGFVMVMERVPILLQKNQFSGLNTSQYEYQFLSSVVSLAKNMIDFGFWVDSETCDPSADYSKIKVLFDALFELLNDPKASSQSTNKLNDELVKLGPNESRTFLHAQVLDFLASLPGFRTNKRISMFTNAYEKIFKQLDMSSDWTTFMETLPSTRGDQATSLQAFFRPCDIAIKSLETDLFRTPILSDTIKVDTYSARGWDEAWIQVMLRLCQGKDAEINQRAIPFILRNMSARSRIMNTFNSVQFLVSDQEAAVFQETRAIIRRLSYLSTQVSQMNAAAYEESQSYLDRLVEILKKEKEQDVRRKTREIMFNLGTHKVILDNFILNLQLERDSSRREGGKQAMDIAKDLRLKDILQRAYEVLLELVHGCAKAQQACTPLFGIFKSHVGIENLNVVGTVAEVLRDRTDLWLHVQKSVCEYMVTAIITYGRRSRWLSFLEVFCEVHGIWAPVVKPFQAKISELLLLDKEVLLDLTLDYTNSRFLSQDDPRYGKTRFQLLQDRDYKEKYFSLAQYHVSSLKIMALCCAGKNRVVQMSTCALIPLFVILDNLLRLQKPPSGAEPIRDCDAIHHVKRGWAHLLLEAYLNSTGCYEKCERVQREHEMIFSGQRNCLMKEICRVFELLSKRLHDFFYTKPDSFNSDKVDEISMLSGTEDQAGGDILLHIEYAAFCIEIAQMLFKSVFCRKRIFESHEELPAVFEHLKDQLEHSARNLHKITHGLPLYRKFSKSLVEMLSQICGGNPGVSDPGISSLSASLALRTRRNPPERKEKFLKGWDLLRIQVANIVKVYSLDGKSSDDEVKDIALLFGSFSGALSPLIDLLRQRGQKDLELLEAGLRVLSAILYVNPEKLNQQEQDREYKLFLENQSPTDAWTLNPRFTSLQSKFAKMGVVDVILSCFPSRDKAVVSATLKLAINLMDGGNDFVQETFYQELAASGGKRSVESKVSTNGLFFEKLHLMFEDAIVEIKESKRRLKLWARTTEELEKAGMDTTLLESDHDDGHRVSAENMAAVIKMMRRMMIRNTRMQNLFRVQPSTGVSKNFIIQTYFYVEALEPDLKAAVSAGLHDKDAGETVEICIRAFRMLVVTLEGPNRANQQSLASTGIFDLVDRIISHMEYESAAEPHPLRDLSNGTGAIDRDKRKSALKITVIDCLNSFLSGGLEDNEFAQQMLSLLDLWQIAKHMYHCFIICTRQTPSKELADLAKLTLQEGASYCILMRHLIFWDKNYAVLYPIISDKKIAPAWDFFQRRCGYVEVMHNGVLQGIHYPLPEDNLSNDLLEKMYETERVDIDKKNCEWLFILTNLVERVERHAQIRSGNMAFAVNYFSSITSFCLFCAFCIHVLCVMGNYNATDEYRALHLNATHGRVDARKESVGEESPSTDPGETVDNPLLGLGTGFELTAQDIYFFQEVEEPMRWIIRVMCWINLAACALRFASFVIAELPVVLHLGLKNKEEEEAENQQHVDEGQEEEQEYDKEKDVPPLLQLDDWKPPAENANSQEVPPTDEDSKAFSQGGWRRTLLDGVSVALTSERTLYEMLYIIFAALAVVYDEPLATVFSLFDICFWPGISVVLNAFRHNAGKMGETILLGLLCMYVWMVIGLLSFNSEESTLREGICVNMFQCFSSFLFRTIRGDGLKDVMALPGEDFRFPTNIVDAFMGVDGYDSFAAKLAWDISFQVWFLYILLSIITGIIIDGFGGLREARDASEEDLKLVCFVCSLKNTNLDLMEGTDFNKHVHKDHNPEHYLKYLIYLWRKPKADLTLQQSNVMQQVWPLLMSGSRREKRSVDWLPREACIRSLHNEQLEKATEQVNDASKYRAIAACVASVETNVKTLAHALETTHTEHQSAIENLAHALETTRTEHKSAIENLGLTLMRIEAALTATTNLHGQGYDV